MGLKILKSKRALLGLTQVQAAHKMGINIKSYNLKENGKRLFSLDEVVKVSKVLDLSLEEVNKVFLNLDIKS
ncbi:MAG: helix-turn-helix transcriptional regulator [Romboutsia sp.]|uniref:helix-turn-helix transcriptional regulator n=1 Tax=Romboutsia sp. TaxID=1965302 RepID=UPI003F364F5E